MRQNNDNKVTLSRMRNGCPEARKTRCGLCDPIHKRNLRALQEWESSQNFMQARMSASLPDLRVLARSCNLVRPLEVLDNQSACR